MAKTLLRSGNLDDFQAVGGGGQAVFESALQIREALRLRKQQAIVDCLAIPQVNDSGDRVDWYSPVEGSVTSWKAADEDDRYRALRYLENTLASVESLSKKCLQSPKTAQQLFGSLLSKAFQFPGENFLFLVDGKPVISFWGFVNLNENARDDVLDCLRESLIPEPAPVVIDDPEPEPEPEPVMTFEHADEPLIAPSTVVRITPEELYEPEPAPVVAQPVQEPAPANIVKKRRVPLWALPVAAVIVAAVAAPLLWPKQAPSAEPAPAPAPEPVEIAPKPIKAVEPLAMKLPLHQAEVVASKEKEAAPAEAAPQPAPVVIVAIPKDAMVMEANQVKAGSTRFLNGTWRAILDVKDPVTGKPPSLRYQIQNNKGFARVVHGDNIVCRAEVFSGLHSNGELMIKSRGTARCTDGSRYPMPEIACKAGTSDIAECRARYDANTVVPLTFKKAGA
ncbi:SrfA family protein [Enterobacter roggenkampii]|uniref:SrfA family protein n=1 Tax=Enterobacter cloacae complex TaxID=354276 RepID=UPI001A8E61B9|nr:MULTISPECIES: SrfA family protein [Enterobacter cloacae complex]EKS6941078.1 ssrAB-activated protein [Enterobacter roggenkampii]MBN9703846.1 ssrAB-activated protein [Enterobacter roggenkampii]MCC3239628.1 SrfA family protein [Enterobacter cloacae complex sp. 2021EL-01169]MCU6178191.1 ssrAB-activated protein [Enterobacter roggenkampii]WGG56231.1 SrfA family protein [Enterobacter roggenkampii]